ncbi:MAG: thiamine-phosphate kinase [Pseudomonadota bacterium]
MPLNGLEKILRRCCHIGGRAFYHLREAIGRSPARTATPWRDEFALISRLLSTGAPGGGLHPALRLAPGDDACLLQALSNPVITTDTQREGIHFRFDWQTPEEIGRKAVSVTLSDLAASYATPVALFINLCLPKAMSEETILQVYRGIHQGLGAYGCALGGGNTSSGERFSLDLFAIGQGREDIFPTRSTAKPGFGLYVTGPLGLARAGLEALQRKNPDFPGLIRRFKAPVARFDAATVLATHGVQCVMDISDGLAGDARHIAKASNLSIEIDLGKSKINEELSSFCRKYGLNPATMAVSGGEDYELLFACPPETFTRIIKMLPEAFQAGRCLDYQGQHLVGTAAGISSFQHG